MKTSTITKDYKDQILTAHSPRKCFNALRGFSFIIYVVFILWSVYHCTNPPHFFIPSGTLLFFCYFGGRFYFPFNHPSTSLFVFFVFFIFVWFFFSNLFTCTEKHKHLISVVRLYRRSHWVLLIWPNSNHKLNHPGGGHNIMKRGNPCPRQSDREDSCLDGNKTIWAFVDHNSSCCLCAALLL